jgi:membrane protease YdiL (CAAX protease family)
MSNSNNEAKVEDTTFTDPNVDTILKIIKDAVVKLKDKTAIILWSSFILLTLWGLKGNADMIFPEKWRLALFPDLAWRDQLVSFLTGFILLVVIPCCIIKFYFKECLSDYGLGWTNDKVKLGLVALCVLLIVCIPIFYLGTSDAEMQAEYPMFGDTIAKGAWGEFIVYQLVYFLFFIVIEFIFRGYLLFGLFGPPEKQRAKAAESKKPKRPPLYFGMYAILIQMLAYTMWHIAKPTPEYMGALVWGIVVAAIALKIKSIWPIIIVHWMLNVFIDTVLWLKVP